MDHDNAATEFDDDELFERLETQFQDHPITQLENFILNLHDELCYFFNRQIEEFIIIDFPGLDSEDFDKRITHLESLQLKTEETKKRINLLRSMANRLYEVDTEILKNRGPFDLRISFTLINSFGLVNLDRVIKNFECFRNLDLNRDKFRIKNKGSKYFIEAEFEFYFDGKAA